jgi:formyltetrahydrofolate deformylase
LSQDADVHRVGILLVACPDRPGIVAAVARCVADLGGNVVDLQQHTDPTDAAFFQRVAFEIDLADGERPALEAALAAVAADHDMAWTLRFADERPRVAILASKEAHCLQDLLNRCRSGELPVDVELVVSNHPDHGPLAEWHGVEHHHLPIVDGDRAAQEARISALLRERAIDLVVLARYMQILSPERCAAWPNRIINIHHSFLPAFQGARPYHQAHDRGVKIVGVTAHYATAVLDDGPIIEQDVVRVTHRDDVDDLKRKGRDLEVTVLARAVRAHVSHRVLVYGRRTVVFRRVS